MDHFSIQLHLRSQSEIVHSGFMATGIVEFLESDEVEEDDIDITNEDPFQDLD